MTDVQFRQATADDAPDVLAIKRAAIRELAGWEYDADQLDAWAPDDSALSSFEAAIDSDRFTVLLAETDGDLAGYGVLNGLESRIDAAYVHPDHSRHGIATSLVGQLEMRARMRGIHELAVVASLNATAFYESLGYRQVDTETRSIDDVDIEFAEMSKRLDTADAE